MKKNIGVLFLIIAIIVGWYFFGISKKAIIKDNIKSENISQKNQAEDLFKQDKKQNEEQKIDAQTEIIDATKFSDSFDGDYILEETGKMGESASKNWWVNSGALLFVNNGTGKTIFGKLSQGDKWQTDYKNYNASETDDGYHPQNIFRLVAKSKWKNFQQECYYKINRYILSKTKERSESNGLLLFNRYQDGNNLYYTGIRVDGFAVIKKKINGKYYTMAYNRIINGKYNRNTNPNLLPKDEWIGVKSEVGNNPNGTVLIKLYIDRNRSGDWVLALKATDNGKSFGGAAIKNEGYAGIRTDFMDVEFDDYKIEETK